MACSCGRKVVSSKVTYLATFADGTKKVYASKVEAMAAVQRKGGSWKQQ